MKQKIVSLLMMITILFSGCASDAPVPESRTFTDSCGRVVTLPQEIDSIAPSGAMTQMVLLPLASDLFCGLASDWSSDAELYLSEDILSLPIYGQIYGGKGDVNFETVLSLSPDLIIDIGESKDGIGEDMDNISEQTGIPTVHIDSSLAGMADTYRLLGELLGRNERAVELVDYCDDTIARTRQIMESVGEQNRKSVIYCLGDQGLNVLAKDSYHAELLDMLCNNAAVLEAPVSSGMGNEVDMEQLLLWNPEVILFAPDSVYDSVAADPLWSELSAIKSNTYYQGPQGPYNWMGMPPSINRYMGMIWLTSILYPDYADYDLFDETSRYYKLFYGCDLTDQMYHDLIQ